MSVDSERGRVGIAFEDNHAEYDLGESEELALAYRDLGA